MQCFIRLSKESQIMPFNRLYKYSKNFYEQYLIFVSLPLFYEQYLILVSLPLLSFLLT